MLPYNLRTKVAPSEGRPSRITQYLRNKRGLCRAGGAESPIAIYRPSSSNGAFGPMGAKAPCMHAPDLATLAHLVRAPPPIWLRTVRLYCRTAVISLGKREARLYALRTRRVVRASFGVQQRAHFLSICPLKPVFLFQFYFS